MPTRQEAKALERVFAAEITFSLPYQSKATVFLDLEKDGLVERMVETLPGHPPVKVEGWTLTLLGNYTYCQACPVPEELKL